MRVLKIREKPEKIEGRTASDALMVATNDNSNYIICIIKAITTDERSDGQGGQTGGWTGD